MNILAKLASGAAWPFKRLSKEVGEEIAEKVALSVASGLREVPILDAALDGRKIRVQIDVQLAVVEDE